ncbi:transcription factor TFIIB repeat domain-containing protein [Trichoderma breve]|uniref:Transcription factor TFIIB repeat domain-containing protein n=1 Tax=Trichoderma breve TaxID=2034170 RepID=A0A9W9JRS7_9HYPO|nr:transcription factor TFIIB repeat domain-containing protein [Trichoderma breve]KAJ4864811.1 transcription factor TFIIB repeat domain-containing protein [Trichoderma breve]
MVEVKRAAYRLDQPKFPFIKGESAGDNDAQEHDKPESSRKVSPGAPSNTSQPTSWKGHHHEAYKEIGALCEAINAGANVSKSAKGIFGLIDRRKFTNGKPQEAVVAICVFVACRQQNVRRTLEEVLRHTRTSKEEAVRVFEQFRDLVYSLEDAEAESAPEIPVETSTAGKRTNDEDAQESKQKRRRVMSESDEDSDTERLAASRDKSKAAEAIPTLKRAEKRKRPDDSEDEARDKRPRTNYSPVPDLFQVPDSPIRGQPDGYASSTDPWASSSDSRESSPGGLSPIAVHHDDASDRANWQWPRKKTRMPGASASGLASSVSGQSPPNQHLGTVDASQALPRGGAEQPPVKDTPADAVDSKRTKGVSRAIHRLRVDKRWSRRDQETSSPQKQPLQKSRRERKASPSVDQVVRSRRSSRRDTRQKLLFLDEDGTPCVAAYKRET